MWSFLTPEQFSLLRKPQCSLKLQHCQKIQYDFAMTLTLSKLDNEKTQKQTKTKG